MSLRSGSSLHGGQPSSKVPRGRVGRRTRKLGPTNLQRLQSRVRAIQRRPSERKAEDVVTGFLDADQHARGRPVGLVVDKTGALLIADDVGNTVWRVTPAGQ